MSTKEVSEILGTLIELPDDKKQFVLGYAAGVATAETQRAEAPPKEVTGDGGR